MDADTKASFDAIVDNPAQWLIVSKVTFGANDQEVQVGKAEGHVCPRCWNIVTEQNEDDLCDRCTAVLKK